MLVHVVQCYMCTCCCLPCPKGNMPTPNLLQLKTMKGPDHKPLKIIPRIAAGDYMTFGMCLLQDENGDQVELVKRDHRQDSTESVTQAIIKKWLTSGAAPTRTYQHLIECLRQSELGALAEEIANTIVEKGNYGNFKTHNTVCIPAITNFRCLFNCFT